MRAALVVLAIVVDIAGANLGLRLGLSSGPDLAGAFVVGALLGPWAAGLVGLLGAGVWNLVARPPALPFAVVGLIVGLFAGWLSRRGGLWRWRDVALAGLAAGIVGAAVSAAIAAVLYVEPLPLEADPWRAFLGRAGRYFIAGLIGGGPIPQPLSILISFLAGRTLLEALPRQWARRPPC